MSQFFEKNLGVIQACHPYLHKKITDYVKKMGMPSILKDDESKPNVLIKEGEWLYGRHKDEAEKIKKLVSQLHTHDETVVLVWLGVGLGQPLVSYLQNPNRHHRFLVIYEPRIDFFIQFLSLYDLSSLLANPAAFWLVDLNSSELQGYLNSLYSIVDLVASVDKFLMVEWGYAGTEIELFKKMWDQFVYYYFHTIKASFMDSYYGFTNVAKNIPQILNIPLLDQLRESFKGKPGILVSAGPSLKEAIPYLQKIQGSAVVFAAGALLKILPDKKIFPDLTGCLERITAMTDVFDGVDTSKMTLVSTPVVNPKVYDLFQGPTFHLVRGHHFLPWLWPDVECNNDLMLSVSHVGLYTLGLLGCNPIYMVGQDMAFDPDSGQTHTEGYAYSMDKQNIADAGEVTIEVEGNSGKPIRTRHYWYQFAHGFELMKQSYDWNIINVISERYGVKLKNIERQDPQSAFGRWNHSSLNEPAFKTLSKIYSAKISEHQKTLGAKALANIGESKKLLIMLIEGCDQLIEEIFDFYEKDEKKSAQNMSSAQMQQTKAFLMGLEQKTAGLMQNPLWPALLNPILIYGQLDAIVRLSYQIMEADFSKWENIEDKLALSLEWLSAVSVRCKMIDRII